MPNWACGLVLVTGTKPNVINFISRFIHSDDSGKSAASSPKFFARSFTNTTRQAILEDIKTLFAGQPADAKDEFSLPVDFAWSAHSCLIQGYPQDFPTECITLMDACKEDQVSVEISTEESGMYFEEYITCDNHGQMTSESKELLTYKCPHCGNTMGLASFIDTDEYGCYECGETGLEPVDETGGDDHAVCMDGA